MFFLLFRFIYQTYHQRLQSRIVLVFKLDLDWLQRLYRLYFGTFNTFEQIYKHFIGLELKRDVLLMQLRHLSWFELMQVGSGQDLRIQNCRYFPDVLQLIHFIDLFELFFDFLFLLLLYSFFNLPLNYRCGVHVMLCWYFYGSFLVLQFLKQFFNFFLFLFLGYIFELTLVHGPRNNIMQLLRVVLQLFLSLAQFSGFLQVLKLTRFLLIDVFRINCFLLLLFLHFLNILFHFRLFHFLFYFLELTLKDWSWNHVMLLSLRFLSFFFLRSTLTPFIERLFDGIFLNGLSQLSLNFPYFWIVLELFDHLGNVSFLVDTNFDFYFNPSLYFGSLVLLLSWFFYTTTFLGLIGFGLNFKWFLEVNLFVLRSWLFVLVFSNFRIHEKDYVVFLFKLFILLTKILLVDSWFIMTE